ncbi:homocysteine S-methyltransferase family protein [Pelagicoccus sp. SDUM812003]|uniref:homocysteine S-methyltransferase family protein n=1 Tax=Pelagicoccus sp. SDUM812003 TaxID=3041267 RepID=UPI0028104481|nr:homocysteine S-methyltransferase family protein [Pelagicoccus sp. SDUM812003]MDQ8204527.1 homocysteine S-methyltransferase family protein [Pelagicoccus sp. SDUM812003]
MSKTLIETLKERVLVSDGAMGTQLMAAGLESGNSGELWNLTHPERVLEIQRRYVASGSNCIITNTFGGNGLMMRRHGHFDQLAEINQAAVKIARQAFDGQEGFVFGDVGPVGGVMEPYGDLKAEDVREGVRIQIQSLVEAGVDAIIIETQTALEEIALGVEAAKAYGAPCIIASLAYDKSHDGTFFRTMMGVSPEKAAEELTDMGVDVLALNCGTGIDMNVAREIIEEYKDSSDAFTMAQPNAGLPVLENLKAVYKQTPDEMVSSLDALLEAGVNIVGGCCGSNPDHIRAIRQKVDAWNAR